ncbi:MAG: hypothetical protein JW778_04020 [Candidatus Altiarchaeota archaeon]|nr:hypothetical protein [Candidatus Altiarchaeota archaeon]
MTEEIPLEVLANMDKVKKILEKTDHSDTVKLKYEGNKKGEWFKYKVERGHSKAGKTLVHGQEIYGNPDHCLSERQTYEALNHLVRTGRAETTAYKGLFWYSVK